MKNAISILTTLATVFALTVFGAAIPDEAAAVEYCGRGAAVPPFLGGGVDPNLLLMLDNSASMLDLAYVESTNTCYDDSYASATTYAGYFENDPWYAYDSTNDKFVEITDAQATTACNAANFKNSYVCIAGATNAGELTSVTGFAAKGNYLNWVASSKLDIQKEILTGGKYDDASDWLLMEARGCGGRRFVKEVAVVDSTNQTNYLTLAVRPPHHPNADTWEEGVAYTAGDLAEDTSDRLWVATTTGTSNAGASTDPSPETDTGVIWKPRFWKSGTTYAVGDIVNDPSETNTIDEGQLYIATTAGTASGTGVDDDLNVTWEKYDLTHIEVYTVGSTAFSGSCQLAVEELQKESPNQGQLKQYIDDCMDYKRGQNQGDISNYRAAFNHAIHNCWYESKHDTWPPGNGPVQAIKPACEAVYDGGTQPWQVTTDNPAYVCYGVHTGDTSTDAGYVGRCWEPPTGGSCLWGCFQPNGTLVPGPTTLAECQAIRSNYDWETYDATPSDGIDDCAAGQTWDTTGAGHTDVNSDGGIDEDDCIEQALKDYCGVASIPEVIDPSDQVGSDTGETEEFWNIPAVLIDSGVVAQLGEAIAVMMGRIDHSDTPSGLVQEFADDIRMGAMVFNDSGSASECNQTDPFVLYECSSSSNKDGGKVISDIDQSDSHTDDLVEAINGFKATSWTPLAEAYYNAFGYYKQDTNIRLNTADWGTTTDPVEYWCQNNNILIITEGASTADLNTDVYALANTSGKNDTDSDTDTTIADVDCGALDGSTLLDDLTYYVQNTDGVLGTMDGENKRNIDTHIVVAGTARDDGDTECSPFDLLTAAATNGGTTLQQASDPDAMEEAIRNAFSSIRAGAAAGSAASVISASRGGEGAAYQAIFWADLTDSNDNEVEWVGEVHGLLVDSLGNLYEDTDADRTLDTDTDQRVAFFFDENLQRTRVCDGTVSNNATCSGTVSELDDIKYLWSAVDWLAGISPSSADTSGTEILEQRSTANYISSVKRRHILTWSDLDADGIVDSGEVLDFEDTVDWENLSVNSTDTSAAGYRAPVPYDFGVTTSAEVDAIVNWVRGQDATGLRSRKLLYDYDGDGTDTEETWRLGDVVHSTPLSVAAPAEGFQFLYRDSTYAAFVNQYKKRRHVIYYGANDGLFHAVNGGFYDETQSKFCKTADCTNESAAPELGAELWAYAPYNLLPHLKCLTETGYTHKYFVDLRSRIFDVRIFPDDTTHPNGWGTILVGGMRFGGAKVNAAELDLDGTAGPDYPDDSRQFTSSWFIFDITDPESPPVLLGEFTRTTASTSGVDDWVDLGYTFAIPTLVTMKNDPDTTDSTDLEANHDWYLILGSGPTEVNGTSDQNPTAAVIPLRPLANSTDTAYPAAFRIPNALPNSTTETGVFTLAETNGWVSDTITADFDLDFNYMADAVYFGTISGQYYDDDANTGGWGGGVYRLVTRKMSSGEQVETEPHEWDTLLGSSGSNPVALIDLGDLQTDNPGISLAVGQPISSAPTVGTDGKNFWLYIGTGRFLYDDDKTDTSSNAQNSFYGIKEPMTFATVNGECVGTLTWETVEYSGTRNTTPGSQGLVRSDQILVAESTTGDTATLSCEGGGTACLPDSGNVDTFSELVDWIAGTGDGCTTGDESGTDGWYRNFSLDRERNLGQGTLLGGLITYTTFQPYSSICQSEGLAYLYGVFYQTGTAYFEPVFITDDDDGVDDAGNVTTKVDLGRGLATTPNLHVGKQEGAKAFVQTSTGTIVEVPQPNLPIKSAKAGRQSWEVVR